MTTSHTSSTATASAAILPAGLALTGPDGPGTPCDVDVHGYALSAPAQVLAVYAYGDGTAHHAELATHATGWLHAHATACSAGLLATHGHGAGTTLELSISPEHLRPWLSTHRPEVLLAVLAAEVTSSSRWVHHDELLAQLTELEPDVLARALSALSAMTPGSAATTAPGDFLTAVLAATRA